MAAFRLASKGKTMADSSYESETQSILNFLSMQHPSQSPAIKTSDISLEVDDFVAPRFVRKMKSRQVTDQTTLLFVASRVVCAHVEKHACTYLYVEPSKLY